MDKRKWFRIFLVFVAAAILEATSIIQFRELYNTSKQAARKTAEHILTTSRFAILDVVEQAEQAVVLVSLDLGDLVGIYHYLSYQRYGTCNVDYLVKFVKKFKNFHSYSPCFLIFLYFFISL